MRLSLCGNVGSSVLAKSHGVQGSGGVRKSEARGCVRRELKGECRVGSDVASGAPS